MDLLGRVAVIVIVLIVVFSIVFLLFTHNTQQKLTSQQAEQFVLNDVRASNPNANITVIDVSNSTLKNGSYNVVLSIVYNSTRPCPTLFIEAFDYPATGLVPSVDNLYTKNCVIYGLSDAPSYVISSPEIAIARSYNQSTHVPLIANYVNKYGYSSTNVSAMYYSNLNNTQTHLAQSYYNVWLVHYTAPTANYSVYAVLGGSTGAIIDNYTSTP